MIRFRRSESGPFESKIIARPVIACTGGESARTGTRLSRAGALVEGGRSTHEGKVARLRRAGAAVVESFNDLPAATLKVVGRRTA